MAKVITFGELMLRLQPFNYERFVQATTFEASFGGGEANVAVSLANYGLDAEFVTKLPAHSIGQMAVNSLRQYGVGTKFITDEVEKNGPFKRKALYEVMVRWVAPVILVVILAGELAKYFGIISI